MSDYEARAAVRRAVREAVLRDGGEMVTRPVMRGRPDGGASQEPEPLAGISAAVAIERAARRECLDSIRYAREDGLGWDRIGEALGFGGHGGTTVAGAAYRYGNPGAAHADWFTWTCPSCAGLIRDCGPGAGNPHDAEQGHAEGCTRLAEAVRAHDARWEDGSDDDR